jgi:hypothetical protein
MKQKMWERNMQEIMEERKKDKFLLDKGFSSNKVMCVDYNSGIRPLLFAYSPNVISLQLCTPKVVGV